jgi:hypothetical protein
MFAGDGAVNFSLLAGYAESYATADADRATIVTAIGRGVGRAAVHEFAHQLLGTALIDDGDDAQSYEYGSAARREQYYGQMHWRGAWPALYKRFGRRELRGAANRSHAAPVRLPRGRPCAWCSPLRRRLAFFNQLDARTFRITSAVTGPGGRL